jgi:hypothetical protein
MLSIAFRLLRNAPHKEVKYSIIKAQELIGGEDISLHTCQNFYFCDYLLGRGADINFQNAEGNTKLHNAIYQRDMEEVLYILDKNPNLEVKNRYGYTPLITSTINYEKEIFRELLKHCNPRSSIKIMGEDYNSLQLIGDAADDDVILYFSTRTEVVWVDHSSYIPLYKFKTASGKVVSRFIR